MPLQFQTNVYIAATFGRKDEAIKFAEKLFELDHAIHVVSNWIWQSDANLNRVPENDLNKVLRAAQSAERDIDEVRSAHVLVEFTGDPPSCPPSGGGRHIEFGIAIALGTPVVVFGPKENVFHQLQWILFAMDAQDTVSKIAEIQQSNPELFGTPV